MEGRDPHENTVQWFIRIRVNENPRDVIWSLKFSCWFWIKGKLFNFKPLILLYSTEKFFFLTLLQSHLGPLPENQKKTLSTFPHWPFLQHLIEETKFFWPLNQSNPQSHESLKILSTIYWWLMWLPYLVYLILCAPS